MPVPNTHEILERYQSPGLSQYLKKKRKKKKTYKNSKVIPSFGSSFEHFLRQHDFKGKWFHSDKHQTSKRTNSLHNLFCLTYKLKYLRFRKY